MSEDSTPIADPAATPAPITAPPITVSPFYHSAVNAVTEPDKYVACSRYFVTRWMPLLGNEGTRIVLALRSLGYYNPKSGERRDHIPLERRELADRVGCSERTLIRELGDDPQTGQPRNWALAQFVQRRTVVRRNPRTGRVWQEVNQYQVSMDDPVHPDDWPRVAAAVQQREAQTAGPGEKTPARHFVPPVPSETSSPARHSVTLGGQNVTPDGQNGAPPQSLDLRINLKTPEYAAAPPGVFASLLPEPSDAPPAYLVAWHSLPEREKEKRLERACAQAGNQVVAGVHLAKETFRQEFEGRETENPLRSSAPKELRSVSPGH